MMSSERPVLPGSANDETSWREPSGMAVPEHKVCPAGPSSATSFTAAASKTAWRIAATAAGSHDRTPSLATASSAATGLIEAGLGEGHGPPSANTEFRLRLPVDKAAKPEVERHQGGAGQQHTKSDRNNILARKRAHNRPLDGAGACHSRWYNGN